MKKRWIALCGAALLAICILVLATAGRTCVVRVPVPADADTGAISVELEQDRETVRLTGQEIRDGMLELTFESVSRGKAYFTVTGIGDSDHLDVLYVHPLGTLTRNSYFGSCRAGIVIPLAAVLFLGLLIWDRLRKYRREMQWSLYRHRNVRNLGILVWLSVLFLGQIRRLFSYSGLSETIRDLLSSASGLSMILLPVAFILAILVSLSNLQLMRKEGRNWRNMLGFFLGLLLCAGTLVPHIVSEILQRSTVVNVHDENGAALYVEMAVHHTVLVVVAYLECILIGTIVLSLRAARRIPEFDRDYMLILGCQIRKDGTLTNLLRGRADRALEFARMQKEATGRDLIFVPSGGQGADEVLSEGEAIAAYLREKGIPEDRILPETRSRNTEENFRFSMEQIRRHGGEDGKLAFSTTNYHVFRSGILAAQQGILAEGIGSPTRAYFWINAFVREFIANLVSERKTHGKILAVLVLLVLAMVAVLYVNNNI